MLRALDEDLWVAEAPLRIAGIEVGMRMTVVRLPDGGLWLHSPLSRGEGLAREVEALGPVRHLGAPNLLHHLFLGEWASAWPGAKLHGPVGLPDKRKDLRFDSILVEGRPDPAWAEVIDQAQIFGAPRVNEVVFCHRPSRTLLLADLAFHICGPVNWITRAYLRLTRAHGRLRTTASMRAAIRDRAAARASAETFLAWDFDRVVVAHGDVLEHGGPAAVRDAFGWM